MGLVEYQLFETINKVDKAIARLKEFEPNEGYYGAFSGGKDSVVIKALVKMAGVKCDWHYNWTTVDPPELLAFIKKQHPDVERHRPSITMWELIVKKRMPPTRRVRYCCEVLKEDAGSGRVVITGIRWAESSKRSKRRMVEQCNKNKGKTYINPIIDWEDEDIWQFIHTYNIPYCSLYNEGFKRLGCIMCPMAGKKAWKEAARWPKIYQAYVRAFQRMVDKRKTDGFETQWETGEEVALWWVNNPPKGDPDQTIMFE